MKNEERRRHRRTNATLTVSFRGPPGPHQVGQTVDVSPGGVLLRVDAAVPEGQAVELTFSEMAEETDVPVRVWGRVVRGRKDGKLHALGIEFDERTWTPLGRERYFAGVRMALRRESLSA